MRIESEITRPAQLENLPVIRNFVERLCQQARLPAPLIYDLVLAVDEICTNVVTHGYKDLPPGPITVKLQIDSDHVQVDVGDRGRSFNPQDAPAPDLGKDWKERRIGGLGLFLVGQVADAVSYETDADGMHHLVLIRRLGKPTHQDTQKPETGPQDDPGAAQPPPDETTHGNQQKKEQ
jgi:serine/threonine-protein kinase RsbW